MITDLMPSDSSFSLRRFLSAAFIKNKYVCLAHDVQRAVVLGLSAVGPILCQRFLHEVTRDSRFLWPLYSTVDYKSILGFASMISEGVVAWHFLSACTP